MVTQQRETLYEDAPATAGLSNVTHNLIQTLNEKLDAVWRYDKYLQDCQGESECASMYRKFKEDDLRHIQMLRDEIARHCQAGTFS